MESTLKLSANQITESPREVRFSESPDEMNELCSRGGVDDFHFPSPLDVDLVCYRSGQELFFQGRLKVTVQGRCGRCLKTYSFPMDKYFDLVLTPEPAATKSGELARDEVGLSYYGADEIHLAPLIREQALLALPFRPLCHDGCRGFCPGCGMDLNGDSCRCEPVHGDPRMAIFRNLRVDR